MSNNPIYGINAQKISKILRLHRFMLIFCPFLRETLFLKSLFNEIFSSTNLIWSLNFPCSLHKQFYVKNLYFKFFYHLFWKDRIVSCSNLFAHHALLIFMYISFNRHSYGSWCQRSDLFSRSTLILWSFWCLYVHIIKYVS